MSYEASIVAKWWMRKESSALNGRARWFTFWWRTVQKGSNNGTA
jgi:hypothetical protein